MNRLKAKERYYAVRVSKGPFCPDDLFRDIWDKIKKQHEHYVLLIRVVCLGSILRTLSANVLNTLDALIFAMIGEIWINLYLKGGKCYEKETDL